MAAYDLASWFQIPVAASGPLDDEIREDILRDVYQFRRWACEDGVVIAQGPRWRAMMEVQEFQGCILVLFDAVEHQAWRRIQFWMNKSSVSDLGDLMRAKPELRVDFMQLLSEVLEERTISG